MTVVFKQMTGEQVKTYNMNHISWFNITACEKKEAKNIKAAKED